MKIKGNTTKLDYVSHRIANDVLQEPHAVFLVQFDSEWDMFFSQKANPDAMEIERCKGEIELWYRRHFDGTDRVLPVLVLKLAEYTAIKLN